MCVFCNQRSISGKQSFHPEDVEREIERALDTLDRESEVEIAYFGGSFTGIDRELMIYLLDTAQRYVDREEDGRARVSGIRMSTRPDYINDGIMEILSRYSVRTVELGLQSMDGEVLERSKRGHSASDARAAAEMIVRAGYSLVGQMMIGLPGSTLEKEISTARAICDMGAVGARIYPTVTFRGTQLGVMAESGEYEMLELEDAVYRSKEVYKIFEARGVDVIRVGLCASDNLGDEKQVMGGANHPALGELVLGELYYDRMRELLCSCGDTAGRTVRFCVPRGDVSKATGQRGRNKARLMDEFELKKIIIEENGQEGITLSWL